MSKSQRRRRKEERRKNKKGRICKTCGVSAHSGSGYCLNHLPNELRCIRITSKGNRCRLPVLEGGVCKVHLVTMQRGYGTGKYGWVYIYDTTFKENGKGIYKIGRSRNPNQREQALRASNPYGRILFMGFVGSQAKTIEGKLHCRYQDAWLERELFLLTETDLDEIYWILRAASTKWTGTWKAPRKRTGVVYGSPYL